MDRTFWIFVAVAALAVDPAAAQTSASYKLQESALNSGGDPRDGATVASASFHMTLDAIGEVVVGTGMTSASFHSDASFVSAYRPAGEIQALAFLDKSDLDWSADPSVGTYAVYRDAMSNLPGTYGACFQSALTSPTVADPAVPSIGSGFFYLITARNRLGEEGTKGLATSGERTNTAPCP